MSGLALFIIDIQNDWLPPDGAMAVKNALDVLPIVQGLLDPSKYHWDLILPSQDYHPHGHISFASTHSKEPFTDQTVRNAHGTPYTQTMWLNHCVIGTKGAEIEKGVRQRFGPWEGKMMIARKGSYSKLEAYSAFEAYLTEAIDPAEPPGTDGSATEPVILPEDTEVARYLREKGIGKVVIVGLATDYCVLQTALSSLSAGFDTLLVEPAMRGINEGSSDAAFEKVEGSGGKVVGRNGEDWEGPLKDWIGSDRDDDDFLYNKSCRAI